MTQSVSVISPADRIAIHPQHVELTSVAGEHVLLCKKNDKGFAGLVARVPVVPVSSVLDFLQSLDSDKIEASGFGTAIAGLCAQAQRDILKRASLNGKDSIAARDVSLDGIEEFLVSAGSSSVQVTLALLAKIEGAFRIACAARWAEVKGVSDSLDHREVMNASKSTQDKYWLKLDSVRNINLLEPADTEALRKILALASELELVSTSVELSGIVQACVQKLGAIDRKRAGIVEDDCEDLS